jgi:hypothetical protein
VYHLLTYKYYPIITLSVKKIEALKVLGFNIYVSDAQFCTQKLLSQHPGYGIYGIKILWALSNLLHNFIVGFLKIPFYMVMSS